MSSHNEYNHSSNEQRSINSQDSYDGRRSVNFDQTSNQNTSTESSDILKELDGLLKEFDEALKEDTPIEKTEISQNNPTSEEDAPLQCIPESTITEDTEPDPPEYLIEKAQELKEAFEDTIFIINWNKTKEGQVHKVMESLNSEEFKQVEAYYNKNLVKEGVSTLKEDLYQELKDTPGDLFRATNNYDEKSQQQPLNEDQSIQSDPAFTVEMETEAEVTAPAPVVIAQGSNQSIELPLSVRQKIKTAKDIKGVECMVFIQNVETEKTRAATVDLEKQTFSFQSSKTGGNRVKVGLKLSEDKEVEYFPHFIQVISQDEYADNAISEAEEGMNYTDFREQTILQEIMASGQATDSRYTANSDFYIKSNAPENPLNSSEVIGNTSPIQSVPDIQFHIKDKTAEKGTKYNWYIEYTANSSQEPEFIGENQRIKVTGLYGYDKAIERPGISGSGDPKLGGLPMLSYYVVCEAVDKEGAIKNRAVYKHVEQNEQTHKQYEQTKKYNEDIDKEVSELSSSYENFDANNLIPFKAIHTTKKDGTISTLQLFLLHEIVNGKPQYKILDFSANPAANTRRDYKTQRTFSKALDNFDGRNRYPKGQIVIEIPPRIQELFRVSQDESSNQEEIPQIKRLSTDGASTMGEISDATGWVALGLGVALLVTVLSGGTASPLLVGATALAGGVSAGTGIADELDKENPNAIRISLEAVSLVSSLLGMKLSVWSALGKTPKGWTILALQTVDKVEEIHFAASISYQIAQILGNENLSDTERQRAMMQVLLNASMVGAMYGVGKVAEQKNTQKSATDQVGKIKSTQHKIDKNKNAQKELNIKIEENRKQLSFLWRNSQSTGFGGGMLLKMLLENVEDFTKQALSYLQKGNLKAKGLYLHIQKNMQMKELKKKNWTDLENEEKEIFESLVDEYLTRRVGQEIIESGVMDAPSFYEALKEKPDFQKSPFYDDFKNVNWDELPIENQNRLQKIIDNSVRFDIGSSFMKEWAVSKYLQKEVTQLELTSKQYIYNSNGTQSPEQFFLYLSKDSHFKEQLKYLPSYGKLNGEIREQIRRSLEQGKASIVANDLKQGIEDYRIRIGILKNKKAKQIKNRGGTVGTGILELESKGIQSKMYEGASKYAQTQNSKGTFHTNKRYEYPGEHEGGKNHAEQTVLGDLANDLDTKIRNKEYKNRNEIRGTLYMVVDQRVCSACRQGIDNSDVELGIIGQFAEEFPNVTLSIRNLENSEVLTVQGKNISR